MLDTVAQSSPKLVEELVPKTVSLGEVQRVLRQLLRERVPVRDLTTIAGQKPLVTRRLRVESLSQLTQTLAEHYEKRRAHHPIDYPKIYDRDLRRLFSPDPKHRRSPAASAFLRRNRAKIRSSRAPRRSSSTRRTRRRPETRWSSTPPVTRR